jgi:hypothetical protein
MQNEPTAWGIKSDGDWTEIGWDDEVLHEVEEWYTAQGWQYEYVPLYSHPANKLTDNELNKAFDYYCESDEGVLRFDLELREEWKREQLIRWKQAFTKAINS